MSNTPTPSERLRVWDLPTRLFHWLLVGCILGSIITIKAGETGWHFRFGYAILCLLLFRIIWGFAGPRYARFSSFPPRLRAAWQSLRGAPDTSPGHNPAGALSVYALLASCFLQVATGLFANDGIIWDGPLRKWVSGSTSDLITAIHLANRFVLIALIVLHVSAILWYRVARGKRLTSAMITGDAIADQPEAEPSRDDAVLRIKALIIATLSATAVWLLVR